jgi:hypothetical protein
MAGGRPFANLKKKKIILASLYKIKTNRLVWPIIFFLRLANLRRPSIKEELKTMVGTKKESQLWPPCINFQRIVQIGTGHPF